MNIRDGLNALVICVMAVSALLAETNSTDWTSAKSVVSYLNTLVINRHGAKNVLASDLADIAVPADALWMECLETNIDTNDFVSATRLLKQKKECLFLVMQMVSFSNSVTNQIAAANFLSYAEPLLNSTRNNIHPLPRIIQIGIPANATPVEIQQISTANSSLSNEYHLAVSKFKTGQENRNFHDALQSLCSFLSFWMRYR